MTPRVPSTRAAQPGTSSVSMVLNEAGDDATVTNKQTESLDRPRPYLPSTAVQGYAEVSSREPLGSGRGPRPTPVPGLITQVADGKWSWADACPVPSPPKETHSAILRAGRGQGGREVLRPEGRLQLCSTEAAGVWWPHPLTPQWGGGLQAGGARPSPTTC